MAFAHKASSNLWSSTIKNCDFTKVDWSEKLLEGVQVPDLPEWDNIPQGGNVGVTFQKFIHFDDFSQLLVHLQIRDNYILYH